MNNQFDNNANKNNPKIGIIMGSDSDLPVMKAAAEILEQMGVAYELTIVSAHRTPRRMYDYAQNAHDRGIKVIIAGAGGSAHLPGMVAAITHLPVIGVPVKSSNLSGWDSMLSIVQMPPGIPVATVAINGAANAALLAIKILALSDEDLSKKIVQYAKDLEDMVLNKARKLEEVGYDEYTNSY